MDRQCSLRHQNVFVVFRCLAATGNGCPPEWAVLKSGYFFGPRLCCHLSVWGDSCVLRIPWVVEHGRKKDNWVLLFWVFLGFNYFVLDFCEEFNIGDCQRILVSDQARLLPGLVWMGAKCMELTNRTTVSVDLVLTNRGWNYNNLV